MAMNKRSTNSTWLNFFYAKVHAKHLFMFLHIFITFNVTKTDFLLCLQSLDLFAILIKLRAFDHSMETVNSIRLLNCSGDMVYNKKFHNIVRLSRNTHCICYMIYGGSGHFWCWVLGKLGFWAIQAGIELTKNKQFGRKRWAKNIQACCKRKIFWVLQIVFAIFIVNSWINKYDSADNS